MSNAFWHEGAGATIVALTLMLARGGWAL